MSFQIKERKNNYKKSFKWLIIDFDHVLTRHYNGLKHHFQNMFPEKYHQGYQWDCDNIFINEIRIHIQKKIKSIISTNRVNPKRVILITDNIQSETTDWIWRTSIWSQWSLKFKSEYYACRLGNIRSKLFNLGLKDFFKMEEYIHFDYPNFEADDVIAIITNSILERHPNDSILIVSHDSDFYQLISPRTTIINLDGVPEPERHYPTGLENLWFNIIGGKLANKVPGLKFKKDLLKEFLGTKYELDIVRDREDDDGVYCKVSRSEQHYLICNLENSIKWIMETPDLIENNQHIINQKVLDFKEIPIKYILSITNSFWKQYSNIDNILNLYIDNHNNTMIKISSNPFAVLTVE